MNPGTESLFEEKTIARFRAGSQDLGVAWLHG